MDLMKDGSILTRSTVKGSGDEDDENDGADYGGRAGE